MGNINKIGQNQLPTLSTNGMTKRFVAYLLDWYLGAMVTSLPIGIVSQKIYGNMLHQNLLTFQRPYGLICGVLGFICALLYYIVVPLGKNKGQTLGKRMMKLKIVKENGQDVDIKTMLLRQLVGIILVEGSLYTATAILHQIVQLSTGFRIVVPLMIFGLVIGIASALLVAFHPKHSAFHDLIAKTKVVEV